MRVIVDTNVLVSGIFFSGPSYEKFIACAIASQTKIIISEDKHLLKLSGHKNIEIIKPRLFLEKYLNKK